MTAFVVLMLPGLALPAQAPGAEPVPQPSSAVPLAEAGPTEATSLPPEPAAVAPAPAPPRPTPVSPPAPRLEIRLPKEPPPVARRSVHQHDGFYARLGIGFSGFGDTLVGEDQMHENAGDENTTIGGFATVSELSFGGTPWTGVALGVGIYSVSVVTSTVTQVGDDVLPDELSRPENFTLVGPFFDWYLAPRAGFHIQVALGLASVTGIQVERPRWIDRRVAVGGGAMVGVGNEWWVGDEWSCGILGRLSGGIAAEKDDAGRRWLHFVGASPSVLFTATYH